MIKKQIIKIEQPIGRFFVCMMTVQEIRSISEIKRRENKEGVQRRLNGKKVEEIEAYCKDPDATFPTSIILSLQLEKGKCDIKSTNDSGVFVFSYEETNKFAEIIDGQHRIEGLLKAKEFNFEMPVVLMFDLTEEEKAYVFSTINSNQTKVDKSTIFDLFELSSLRSPFKTGHEIARLMNSEEDSPFYKRLKMLGVKQGALESISQGTFVSEFCRLISSNPDRDRIDIKNGKKLIGDKKLPLRYFFINGEDGILYKILLNYFSAVKKAFADEWGNPKEYILTKTTGFGALCRAFPKAFLICASKKDLSEDSFYNLFFRAKKHFISNRIQLSSSQFGSGVQHQKKLATCFEEAFEEGEL